MYVFVIVRTRLNERTDPLQTTIFRNMMPEKTPGTNTTFQEEAISRSLLPPLSTYWMPLHEAIEQWATLGTTINYTHALSAVGHAFFALFHESRALKHFSQVARERAHLSLPAYWRRYESMWKQAEHDLHETCYHWSRAAFCLDQLLAQPLTAEECEVIGTHSRAARWQQERLWASLDEARSGIDTWRGASAGEAEEGTTHAPHTQEATTR